MATRDDYVNNNMFDRLWLRLWFINTFGSNYANLQCVYKFGYKKVYILYIYMSFIKITTNAYLFVH